MQIIIKGKQMEITPRLREYIERKVQKVSRHSSDHAGDARVEITVSEEHTRSANDRYHVQILLGGGGQPLRAEMHGANVNAAFDQALEKVLAQQARQKDRQTRTRRSRTPPVRVLALSRSGAISTLPDEEEQSSETDEDSYASSLVEEHNEEVWMKIKEIRSVPTKPMSDKEAILQMETLGLSFYPFINEETDEVNVIYRMEGEGYGLLLPSHE